MFKGLAICEEGFEDVSALEIKELIGADCSIEKGAVIFNIKKLEQLCKLCYKAQSIRRVLLLLAEGNFKDIDEIKNRIKEINLSDFVKKETTILVECERIGEHKFSSSEIAGEVGEVIVENLKKKKGFIAKVDLENAAVKFFVFVMGDKFYFGIDFAGFDLSGREYKVFSHPAAMKGTVAYCILRLADYVEDKALLSCFSKSGVIEIEAALFALDKAVNYYRKGKFAFFGMSEFFGKEPEKFFNFEDKEIKNEKLEIIGVNADLRHVSAGNKNAKIAGVNENIDFSRMDVEWFDVKFNENGFDIIIAQVVANESEQMKKEFFNKAAYILAEDGVLVVVSLGEGFEELAKKEGFKLKNVRVVERGQNKVRIEMFGKI